MSKMNFVPDVKFEEYSERFKEHFIMERKDGIISCRMHTEGKTVVWDVTLHRAIHQALREIGSDPENEVLIFTGTGDHFIFHVPYAEESTLDETEQESMRKWASYNYMYLDGTKLVENLVFDLEIPTIGAINGSGFHMEMMLMCDLTICTDDTIIFDPHYKSNMVPGDGIHCALQEILGVKRANYIMATGQSINAEQALEWGMVNEVVPREKIYERAWELGQELMKGGRVMRRITTQVMRKPWKRRISEDLHGAFGQEMFVYNIEDSTHDPDIVRDMLVKAGGKIVER